MEQLNRRRPTEAGLQSRFRMYFLPSLRTPRSNLQIAGALRPETDRLPRRCASRNDVNYVDKTQILSLRAERSNLQVSVAPLSEKHGLPRRYTPRYYKARLIYSSTPSLRAKRSNLQTSGRSPSQKSRFQQGSISLYRQAKAWLALSLSLALFPQIAYAETGLASRWNNLWWTPSQQGQRAFELGDYTTAAQRYKDPMRVGIAWYRAGEFEQAAAAFGRVNSAEGLYNRGNALVLLGQYEAAIAAYDRALEMRPGWEQAQQNRDIAQARKLRLDESGAKRGEATEIGADDVVFDLNAEQQQTQDEVAMDSQQGMSDQELRALWLRKSQTSPAVFLKSKFASQLAIQDAEEGAE